MTRTALGVALQNVYIGQIAMTSMAASLLMFMAQMLIAIPFLVITLVAPHTGWIASETAVIHHTKISELR